MYAPSVAPARERGLKCVYPSAGPLRPRRSREGAWIEIANYDIGQGVTAGRSREGAWIEMFSYYREAMAVWVAPARERGLK